MNKDIFLKSTLIPQYFVAMLFLAIKASRGLWSEVFAALYINSGPLGKSLL